VGPSATPAIVLAHQRDGRLLIEIEPAPVRGEDFGAPTVAQVTAALGRVGRSATLAEAAGAAAVVVRELTGFERVLVYRFDRDWNGVSVAEDRDPEAYDSLLDLYFPASDIPAQARALYARAPARFVFDRDYAPSPLVGDASLGNAPIDLSLVQARSLSPIHLEYQRNLGVNGSMSSSIMVDGRLWGLVIGHHRRPHYVAPETRAAVASATEALGLRIAALEIAESWRTQEAHVNAETLLLERMAGVDHPTEALLGDAPTMLELFGAGGAAFVEDRTVYLLGATPSREQVLDLTEWLVERGQVHASEQLSGEFPPAEAYRAIASGLLAAFTGGERPAVLLWFKPEEVSAIAWGGDPTKAVESTGAGVLPRRSFERWVEERRGASTPWAAWQVAAAGRIARAVENVARRHNRRVAVLRDKQDELLGALEQQKQLLHDKDLLTREIDHRVKNSLQIVASFVKMQSRATADAAARAGLEETYGRVMSVARIHDSLWRSDEVGEVDIGQTIAALCRDLSSMAGEGRSLEVTAGPDIRLPYQQALALSLITLELVTNAVKYAYGPEEAGKVEVDIRAQPEGGVCLTVSDRGRGLPADWAAGARESGLGMKLINAMLSQIKGEMRVETGAGARFVVCA
jgi:light-regulated signal transduction histidine kinase (bacteriophytochrome)